MTVSPAVVAVAMEAMEAMDCERVQDSNGNAYCEAHWTGWLSDTNACARAERIASKIAAVAWDQGWTSGFYKAQARYSDNTEDASEVAARNPYRADEQEATP